MKALAEEGMRLAIGYREDKEGAASASALWPGSIVVRIDVTNVESVAGHQVFRHFQSERSNGDVADESVTGASDSENGGKMTGRSVEYRLRKKKRAGGLRARFYDVVIEAFRVDDAAVRDAKDQRGSFRSFRIEFDVRVSESFESGEMTSGHTSLPRT